MGVFINQGKQDTTQDNKFEIITADNVLAQITKVALAQSQPDTLEITFKILSDPYKNRVFFDRVNYNPNSNFSWKYRALRKAAGCQYNENEGSQIDIEALLLNKAVLVDLNVRHGKNRAGEATDYQNVKYKSKPAPKSLPNEEASFVPPPDNSNHDIEADNEEAPADDDDIWGMN